MALNINYKKITSTREALNLVLFVDENFNILSLKKHVLSNQYSYIADILKTTDKKKKQQTNKTKKIKRQQTNNK